MSPRIQREYKELRNLDVSGFKFDKLSIKVFNEQEKKEIVFKDVVEQEVHHTTILNSDIEPEYQNVIGFFAQAIMRDMRLFGCYDLLFGKVKDFVENYMYESEVELTDLNLLRNLSEVESVKLIKDLFKKAINDLTVKDKGDTEIKNYIKISDARPFIVNEKPFFIPKKSVFNRIIGDSIFELEFSAFLEKCEDVVSFAKNFQNKEASALRIEYKNAEGFLANYYPDFFVKLENNLIFIIETKGREEENDLLKFDRLIKWCEDVNARQTRVKYQTLYVKQEIFEEYKVRNFKDLIRVFKNIK
jgi:type III restriction enzyme